jgi:hypothetical protein
MSFFARGQLPEEAKRQYFHIREIQNPYIHFLAESCPDGAHKPENGLDFSAIGFVSNV